MSFARFDRSLAAPILLGILFFFFVSLGASDAIRKTALVVSVCALLTVAVRFSLIRDRITLPFLALTLYVLMDGISTFYSVSGKFALREFLKVFLAYGMALILLAASPKNEERPGKRIATILAVCAAVGSLVSIDLISTRIISGVVTWILGWFTQGYEEFTEAQEVGRMSSIFGNSNVFSGVAGLGLILSLGLAEASDSQKERCFDLVMAFLNAVALMLTISLGAFAFAFIALLAFALFHKGTRRIRTLVLLAETLVLAVAVAVLIYKMPGQTDGGRRVLPLLAAVIAAAALCVIDVFLGARITPKKSHGGKAASIVGIAIVVLIIAYAVTALSVTWPYTLAPNSSKSRVTYFTRPGTYTLDVRAEGKDDLKLSIRSQSLEQSATSRSTELYWGDLEDVEFTVPEDSVVLFFWFTTEEGARIDSAQYGNYRIPLTYKLLPYFLRDRLERVSASRDVALRVIYYKDGLKLFQRSPVFGLGMGAFENAIKSVQSFYYETKYAHNHYFQTMLETGIVGLALFLALLISAVVAIWKSRKEQPYAPMLGAALVFMAGHALFDLVFSAYAYLPLAYGVFALISLCCGENIRKPVLSRVVRCAAIGVISACTVVYCVFIGGNLYAKHIVDESPTLDSLTQAVRLDKFEWADYALPYVTSVMDKDVVYEVRQQADRYAERLSTVNSNTIPIYLAQYYFCTERGDQGFEMIEKYVDYLSSDQTAWQRSFDVLQAYDDGTEAFHSRVLQIADKLEVWSAENIGEIELDDGTLAYLDTLKS